MKYVGSKAKHATEILEVTLAKRKYQQSYVEPFVGGANIIWRVPPDQGPRIGADINPYMIALHKALAAGWEPPGEVSEQEYNRLRRNPDKFPPELVAFMATGCSFGAKWLDTYARNEAGNNDSGTARGSRNACLEQAPGMREIDFRCASYDELEIPPGSLIYCDPPYSNTMGDDQSGYAGAKRTIKVGESLAKNNWRASKFWLWADRMVEAGHTVFVSEYTAPEASFYKSQSKSPELDAARQAYMALQRDPASTMPMFFEGEARIKQAEKDLIKPAQAMADRWKVVWEKEVVSDFSSTRGKDEGKGPKKEIEKLFHREA